jgi:hypothetical protein
MFVPAIFGFFNPQEQASGGKMTVQEALEMVRYAGSIPPENGKLLARVLEAERARLQPALACLRSHREEAIRLLTPTKPLADVDPEERGMPYGGIRHDRAANGSLLASVPRLRAGSRTEG